MNVPHRIVPVVDVLLPDGSVAVFVLDHVLGQGLLTEQQWLHAVGVPSRQLRLRYVGQFREIQDAFRADAVRDNPWNLEDHSDDRGLPVEPVVVISEDHTPWFPFPFSRGDGFSPGSLRDTHVYYRSRIDHLASLTLEGSKRAVVRSMWDVLIAGTATPDWAREMHDWLLRSEVFGYPQLGEALQRLLAAPQPDVQDDSAGNNTGDLGQSDHAVDSEGLSSPTASDTGARTGSQGAEDELPTNPGAVASMSPAELAELVSTVRAELRRMAELHGTWVSPPGDRTLAARDRDLDPSVRGAGLDVRAEAIAQRWFVEQGSAGNAPRSGVQGSGADSAYLPRPAAQRAEASGLPDPVPERASLPGDKAPAPAAAPATPAASDARSAARSRARGLVRSASGTSMPGLGATGSHGLPVKPFSEPVVTAPMAALPKRTPVPSARRGGRPDSGSDAVRTLVGRVARTALRNRELRVSLPTVSFTAYGADETSGLEEARELREAFVQRLEIEPLPASPRGAASSTPRTSAGRVIRRSCARSGRRCPPCNVAPACPA